MEDRARILIVPSVGPLTVSPRGAITSLLLDGFTDRILVIESDTDNQVFRGLVLAELSEATGTAQDLMR